MTSSSGTTVTEAEVLALQLTFTDTCCQMAAGTLIFHEHMMSLSDEIYLVWGHWQRVTGATILFLLNRYLVLALGVMIILQTVPWSTPLSCEATIILYNIIYLLLYSVSALFSALRAYAIGQRARWQAIITLGLGLVPAGASIFFMAKSSNAYVTVINNMPVCTYTEYYSLQTYNNLILATRICALIADIIVLCITWIHTYRARERLRNVKTPLTILLARDGTLYFLALLLLNILQMVMKPVGGAITNFTASFVAPISGILISRFLMNLRHVRRLQEGASASFVGNLGTLLFDEPPILVMRSSGTGHLRASEDIVWNNQTCDHGDTYITEMIELSDVRRGSV